MDHDPEELLYNLGFGSQVSSPVDRIPSRFLHPSRVSGNDLDSFIVKQEEMWETSSMHLNGYHGLAGFPSNGEEVHGIVGKIHEKIRERNRELKRARSEGPHRSGFYNAAFSVMAARAFRNLIRPAHPSPSQQSTNPTSILEPQNRDFLERQEESVVSRRRRKRPRLVLGKNSFALDTDEELIDEEDCESTGSASSRRGSEQGGPIGLESGSSLKQGVGGLIRVKSLLSRRGSESGSVLQKNNESCTTTTENKDGSEAPGEAIPNSICVESKIAGLESRDRISGEGLICCENRSVSKQIVGSGLVEKQPANCGTIDAIKAQNNLDTKLIGQLHSTNSQLNSTNFIEHSVKLVECVDSSIRETCASTLNEPKSLLSERDSLPRSSKGSELLARRGCESNERETEMMVNNHVFVVTKRAECDSNQEQLWTNGKKCEIAKTDQPKSSLQDGDSLQRSSKGSDLLARRKCDSNELETDLMATNFVPVGTAPTECDFNQEKLPANRKKCEIDEINVKNNAMSSHTSESSLTIDDGVFCELTDPEVATNPPCGKISVPNGRSELVECVELTSREQEIGAIKRWVFSARTENRKRLDRVGSELGRSARGWVRNGNGPGWIRNDGSTGTSDDFAAIIPSKLHRQRSLPASVDRLAAETILVGGVGDCEKKVVASKFESRIEENGAVVLESDETLSRCFDHHASSINEEVVPDSERRLQLRRQSGVEDLVTESDLSSIDSRLTNLSLTRLDQETTDRLTELEPNGSTEGSSSSSIYKPSSSSSSSKRHPPLLCSRAESGFESCDMELRDEMDAIGDVRDADTYSTHQPTVIIATTDQVEVCTSDCDRVVCDNPKHVVRYRSSSNQSDKPASVQPSVRSASLHREFLEKIRHRCGMTTYAAAPGDQDVRRPTLPETELANDRNIGDEVTIDLSTSSESCAKVEPRRDSTIPTSGVTSQDRSRLDEFHEGCVSAVDKMQKSMQLYVKRLRTMEQTWGETYNKWFIASRKSEKRDLNHLADVHKSILEEASQTQALLRDHSEAIERVKLESTCRTVDSHLVVCSSQLRTVAQDLDGIIREQDSMLRQMREMEADDVCCRHHRPSSPSSNSGSDSSSDQELTVTTPASPSPLVSTAPPSVLSGTSLPSSDITVDLSTTSVTSPIVTSSAVSSAPVSTPSTDGIHKLLTKLKQEMTSDIKSTIGEDCVRFEKDLKSTSQQMEDVKSFLSRMLSVIQTNK